MQSIREGASENNLVVIEELELQKRYYTIEITGTDGTGSLSVPYSRARSGMLMQHYQTTLAQCRIPLTEDVLLKYGRQINRAILYMHANGYCHLDIKPSNIFLLGDICHLRDYGAATLVGQYITECTRNYYHSDFTPTAEKKTDFLLLAKTMLELYGTIKSPVQLMSTKKRFCELSVGLEMTLSVRFYTFLLRPIETPAGMMASTLEEMRKER